MPESKPPFKPQPMVGWYDAPQLVATGLKTLISGTFGAYADKREVQAALSPRHTYSCRLADQPEVWVDYMADTGDGFDATFTLFDLLRQAQLTVPGAPGEPARNLPRGNVLVLGGDQVYPVAKREYYDDRLVGPIEAAFPPEPDCASRPELFAIPGNHDWYDGLTNFTKIFCQQRTLGNWQTRQERSYFAVQLPHDWWLWGTDIQLASDIDKPQLDYFDYVATQMPAHARVILCTAEPSWLCATHKNAQPYHNLAFFQQQHIIDKGFELVLTIAGDLHHYARYRKASGDGRGQKITSGGGGAFLHPTHNLPAQLTLAQEQPTTQKAPGRPARPTEPYLLSRTFPSQNESRGLTFKNLAFPYLNWSFSAFMGLYYLVLVWALQSVMKEDGSLLDKIATLPHYGGVLGHLGKAILYNPLLLLFILLIVGGLMAFADTTPNTRRSKLAPVFGLLHGLSHLFIFSLLLWVLVGFNLDLVPKQNVHFSLAVAALIRLALFSAEITVLGGLLAGLLMGSYLLLSNLLLGNHDNEAFSALRGTGYKNFLRLHITADSLTVYPVGVRSVARWRWQNGRFTATEPAQLELIEAPLVFATPAAPPAAAPARPMAAATA